MSTAEQVVAARTARDLEQLPAHGLWVPPLMPLDSDLAIDCERFTTHARWLLDHGCHGIALFGTTSEANSFSVEERIELLEHAVDSGLPPERLMVGTGCCAFPDSVRLTAHALGLGCTRVLMLPPFYYKGMSDEGLFRAFDVTLEKVGSEDLRVYLYHFPQLSGVPITPGLIELLLARHPRIVAGVKDSSGDRTHGHDLARRFPQLAIFPGSESLLLDGLRAGGAGCITASGNANPSGTRAVYDAWRAQDRCAADARQGEASAVRAAIEQHPMVPALKHLTAHYRGDPAWRAVRPPMLALGEADGARLIESVEAAGLVYEA